MSFGLDQPPTVNFAICDTHRKKDKGRYGIVCVCAWCPVLGARAPACAAADACVAQVLVLVLMGAPLVMPLLVLIVTLVRM